METDNYDKRILWLIIGMMVININGHSQSQKQKYIQGLIRSIALYQTYISRLRNGYTIVKNGLNLIHDIKNGEFSLHKDYFNSLESVNPSIKRYTKIAAIMAFQYQIILEAGKLKTSITNREISDSHESAYIYAVIDRLLEESSQNVDALLLVISDKKVKMTDDERMRRINEGYERSANDYNFLMNFSANVKSVLYQKQRLVKEGRVMKNLQGIKN